MGEDCVEDSYVYFCRDFVKYCALSSRYLSLGQRENYVFPFKARFTRDGAKKLKVEAYDMQRFIYLNIALTLLLRCIKLDHRRSMRNLFNYLDLVVTLACGIYGFIAVLIFPNRK